MRIQHNIMALNSSRQLGVNNGAVSKSLEKLSSGYRINRAGDDAAGLAISEKMRAQIKGLTAASDNSQDAISLVQTAEGGLQEVHSMLNRMQELATKSANGTYTDDVDRRALQDEVSALKDEINRISDGTDFNGIKLLDGSMGAGSSGKVLDVTGTTNVAGEIAGNTKFTLSAPEGYTVDVTAAAKGTANSATWVGNKLTITLNGDKSKTYTQQDIDNLIKNASGSPKDSGVKVELTIDKSFQFGDDGAKADGSAAVTLTSEAAKQASAVDNAKGIKVTANKAGVNGKKLSFKNAAGKVGGSVDAATGNFEMNLVAGETYTANDINKM